MPQVLFTLFHFETITAACSARMSAENKLCRQIFENDGHEKMTAKKIIVAKAGGSSCVFSAPDCPETLPKWEPLEKFELCNGLHKRSRNFR
jgi:hypothetical protein